MKKLSVGFFFIISVFCFGCENQNIKTSLIISNPEEEPILEPKAELGLPIEEALPEDIPQEIIEEEKENIINEEEKENLEIEEKNQNNEFVEPVVYEKPSIREIFPRYESIEEVSEVAKKEGEEIVEDSSLEILKKEEEVLDLIQDNEAVFSESVDEELLPENLEEIILSEDNSKMIDEENSAEIEIDEEFLSEGDENIDTSFSNSAPKERLIYSPNRSDLDDFYKKMQSQNKLITPNFSFFCNEDCDDFDLSKASISTVLFDINYLVNGENRSFFCDKMGCREKEILEDVFETDGEFLELDQESTIIEDQIIDPNSEFESIEDVEISEDVKIIIENIPENEIKNETPVDTNEVLETQENFKEVEVIEEVSFEENLEPIIEEKIEKKEEPRKIRIKRKK